MWESVSVGLQVSLASVCKAGAGTGGAWLLLKSWRPLPEGAGAERCSRTPSSFPAESCQSLSS